MSCEMVCDGTGARQGYPVNFYEATVRLVVDKFDPECLDADVLITVVDAMAEVRKAEVEGDAELAYCRGYMQAIADLVADDTAGETP